MENVDLILKYLKIAALAKSGTGGEKTNAERALEALEKKHPGLGAAARAWKEDQEKATDNVLDFSDPATFATLINNVFTTAGSIAKAVANTNHAVALAEQATEPVSDVTDENDVLLGLLIDIDALVDVRDEMNSYQQGHFKGRLVEMFRELVDEFFSDEDEA